MTIANAERKAARLIERLGMTAPPIDVEAVATQLGIRIERADLDEEVSGVLVRNGDRAVIGVNWAHHPNRQRFTIAHELGHFVLHEGGTYVDKGTHARFRDKVSGSGTKLEEIEANAFAAALLMPPAMVKREASDRPFDPADDSALSALAAAFDVSSQAMSIRLANLRLIGDPEV